MIRLRELLHQILEDRKTAMAGIMAKRTGLKKLPGFGNYGLGNYVTHRSIRGQLKPVIPHRLGQKPQLTGKPEPRIRFKGQPKPPAE